MNTAFPTQSRTYVSKLALLETGTYTPYWRRPYTTQLDPGTMEAVVERVHTADRFNTQLLSGIAGQFLRPTAQPERQLEIINGWGERRGRFQMEVVHEYPAMNHRIIEHITGWTDYLGFTPTAIDPRMQFYVNNCAQLREVEYRSPYGMQHGFAMAENAHILADNSFGNVYTAQKEQRMRPEDMYSAIGRLGARLQGDTTDMRTTLTNVALKSRRSNGVPAAYVAGVLEHHRVASEAQEFGSGTQDILMGARGLAAEPSAAKDPFLSAMAQIRGQPISNVFSYGELLRLDPNVDRIAAVSVMGQAERAALPVANNGQYADWSASTTETQLATMVGNAFVSLMMDLGLSRAALNCSNQTLAGGLIDCVCWDIHGFSSVDLSGMKKLLEDRFAAEIFPDLTYGGQIPMNIQVSSTIFSDTTVRVQLGTNPAVPFVIPTYCDSLLVPVLTSNVGQAEAVAADFRDLLTVVQDQAQSYAVVGSDGQSLFGRT